MSGGCIIRLLTTKEAVGRSENVVKASVGSTEENLSWNRKIFIKEEEPVVYAKFT